MPSATNDPLRDPPRPDALGDDVLKRLAGREAERRADDAESLAGALETPLERMARALEELVEGDWLRRRGSRLELTESGRRRGLHLLRSHRLLETQLARESGLAPERWHVAADRAEHGLSPEQANALADRLGNPRFDPHGDPIPDRDGHFAANDAPTLLDWPDGEPALVVHLEDEPPALFKRVHAAGLAPGSLVVVRRRTENRLELDLEGRALALGSAEAQLVHVAAMAAPVSASRRRLTDLGAGASAVVAAIAPIIRGPARQRLLDLGLVPGTRIVRELDATLGSPIAFRVRGTLVALRRDQCEHILIEMEAPQP